LLADLQALLHLVTELPLYLVDLAKLFEDIDDVEPAGHLLRHVLDGFILLRIIIIFN
jgi:hypothetical protein